MIHAGSTSDTPQRRRFVAVGAVSVVAWRVKRSSASLQLWIRHCHERSWCMCLDQSSHRPCSWRVRRWSSCSATSMSWMYWFTRLRIVRGDGGGRSTDGAAGSKAVVCAEFEMTAVLAICASLAGANFRVHSDCRRAKSSAMSRQRSPEEDSSRLSLMCCCCFQSVMRLRTFRPHWSRPPTKRIEGLAHFGSPTHRLSDLVAMACSFLTKDKQRSLIRREQLSFDARKWWYSQIIAEAVKVFVSRASKRERSFSSISLWQSTSDDSVSMGLPRYRNRLDPNWTCLGYGLPESHGTNPFSKTAVITVLYRPNLLYHTDGVSLLQ